jgi:hypothetical protein
MVNCATNGNIIALWRVNGAATRYGVGFGAGLGVSRSEIKLGLGFGRVI